jgi:hypothetical protein
MDLRGFYQSNQDYKCHGGPINNYGYCPIF